MYKVVFDEIISVLRDPVWSAPIKEIHMPQRAKFERYLQAVLAYRLKGKYSDTEIEFPLGDKHADIYSNGVFIELKTPNTNYRIDGVAEKTRPISDNIQGIIDDIDKFRKHDDKEGIVAFVMFPVKSGSNEHMQHIEKIKSHLGNDHFLQTTIDNMFVFSCMV